MLLFLLCLHWNNNLGFRFMLPDWTAVILNTYITMGHNQSYVSGGIACEIWYSWKFLLLLHNHISLNYWTAVDSIPNCLRMNSNRGTTQTKRKRGCKGGITDWRGWKITPYVYYLVHQRAVPESEANTCYLHEYRSACVLAITESRRGVSAVLVKEHLSTSEVDMCCETRQHCIPAPNTGVV